AVVLFALRGASCDVDLEQDEQRRQRDEHQRKGEDQPGDDCDGQRLLHGGTVTDSECKRQQSKDGSERRHENCAHAIDSGQNETVVAWGQVAKFGVIKNRDFSDNADDHGHAHARGDVEFGAGEPKPQINPSDREYRDEQHGAGDAKTFVKKKQEQKDEHDGGKQNQGQAAEGDLLLFVEATESVEDVVRNHAAARQRSFHIAHSRSKIPATDARGDRDHAFEIVAHDFRLAVERGQGGDALKGKEMAVGRAEKKIVDVAHGLARVARNPNAHADEFRALLNFRGDVASEKIVERFGDGVGIHPFQPDFYAIDLNVERVTGRDDSSFHFDDAFYLRDRVGHFWRKRVQRRFVVGIKFDLDRLRHAGQVADQILHQLQKLNLQTGHVRLDFLANAVHHFLNAATRKRF